MAVARVAFIVGLALVPLGTFFSYWWTRDLGVAWLAFVTAAAFTILSRLDDLTEFSLGPLGAKMRQTIAEATATLEQLRNVASELSKVVLADLISGYFFPGMRMSKMLSLHDEVMSSLARIGASQEQKVKAEEEWRKGICLVYHSAIGQLIRNDQTLDDVTRNSMWKGLSEMVDFGEHWRAPPPDKIADFLSERQYTPEDVMGWIGDYRHFVETNEIRNRAKFGNQ